MAGFSDELVQKQLVPQSRNRVQLQNIQKQNNKQKKIQMSNKAAQGIPPLGMLFRTLETITYLRQLSSPVAQSLLQSGSRVRLTAREHRMSRRSCNLCHVFASCKGFETCLLLIKIGSGEQQTHETARKRREKRNEREGKRKEEEKERGV